MRPIKSSMRSLGIGSPGRKTPVPVMNASRNRPMHRTPAAGSLSTYLRSARARSCHACTHHALRDRCHEGAGMPRRDRRQHSLERPRSRLTLTIRARSIIATAATAGARFVIRRCLGQMGMAQGGLLIHKYSITWTGFGALHQSKRRPRTRLIAAQEDTCSL